MSGPDHTAAPSAPAAVNPRDDAKLAEAAMSERDKMMAGLPYFAMTDDSLLHARLRVRRPMQAYNNYPWPSPPEPYFGPDERMQLLADVFHLTLADIKERPIEIEPPFYVDYGDNIEFKGSFYANMNMTILDGNKVTIGTRVLFGPNVHLYAATHSTDVDERQSGAERAYPIEIGDDCWLGGNVTVVGPSKIGNGVTVAAGSVVKGEFPDYCVLAGVPARIVKQLEPPKGLHDLTKYR